MRLVIEAYTEAGYVTLAEETIPNTENWERILRKLYAYIWKHCNQDAVIELFAVMVDADGFHECSQAWAIEYTQYYPKCELPFI